MSSVAIGSRHADGSAAKPGDLDNADAVRDAGVDGDEPRARAGRSARATVPSGPVPCTSPCVACCMSSRSGAASALPRRAVLQNLLHVARLSPLGRRLRPIRWRLLSTPDG